MAAVKPTVGKVLVLPVEQVPDIVQEGRHDKGVNCTLLVGKIGCLERVLHLRYSLAVVGDRTAPRKEIHDFVNDYHLEDLLLCLPLRHSLN